MTETTNRRIKACGKETRYAMSLSNYMYTGWGTKADITELKKTINGQPMNAEKIVNALNSNPYRLKIFRTYKQTDNQIQIIAKDYMGNEDIIYITEI